MANPLLAPQKPPRLQGSLWTASQADFVEFLKNKGLADHVVFGPAAQSIPLKIGLTPTCADTYGYYIDDIKTLGQGESMIGLIRDTPYNRLHEVGHALGDQMGWAKTGVAEEARLLSSHASNTRHGIRVRAYLRPSEIKNFNNYVDYNLLRNYYQNISPPTSSPSINCLSKAPESARICNPSVSTASKLKGAQNLKPPSGFSVALKGVGRALNVLSVVEVLSASGCSTPEQRSHDRLINGWKDKFGSGYFPTSQFGKRPWKPGEEEAWNEWNEERQPLFDFVAPYPLVR